MSLCFDAEPVITEGSVEEIGSFVVPFKTDECLARFLIARDGEATILCADVHHLIFDGVSLNVFLNSLFSALGEEALDSVEMAKAGKRLRMKYPRGASRGDKILLNQLVQQ